MYNLNFIRLFNPHLKNINQYQLLNILKNINPETKSKYNLILDINDFKNKYSEFDLQHYLIFNDDLLVNLHNETSVYLHYIKHGRNEERITDKNRSGDVSWIHYFARLVNLKKISEENYLGPDNENNLEIVDSDSESQYIDFDDSKSKIFSKQKEPKIEPKSEEYFDFDEVVIINKKYEKNFVETTSKKEVKDVKDAKLSNKSLHEFILHVENWIEPDFCDELLNEYCVYSLWNKPIFDQDKEYKYFSNINKNSLLKTAKKIFDFKNVHIFYDGKNNYRKRSIIR